jgi:hypothetical protein
LFDHTGALIAANDNWKDTQKAQIQATGLAPSNNLDAAILITLSPGAYTVFLQGKAMVTGIGLAEFYDVDPSANSQPTNLSARAFVGTGNDVLIGGTIIRENGTSLLRVLVRALGPSFASARVTTPLGRIRRSHCAMPTETSSPVTTTGRIHSRQLLRRLVRHPER